MCDHLYGCSLGSRVLTYGQAHCIELRSKIINPVYIHENHNIINDWLNFVHEVIFNPFIVDGKFDGKGTYTFKSGSVYEGEYKAGIREGKGKFTYASGDVYEGDFVNGLPEGNGVYRFANGDVFEGEFKAGKRNGKGVYTFASGTKQTGVFENSEMIEEISIERPNKKRN